MAAPTADEMKRLVADGKAMPDGSFYIRSRDDLANAIAAVGRARPNTAERRNAVRRHVIRNARRLGLLNLIPDTWDLTTGELKK